ncbi:DUF4013 domain-containing protein [archaeon]|nr:DUF4013 domain-containing protein [archaeon]
MYNIEVAAKRPFTDIKSLVMGIVFMFIPILNFAVIGYMLKCAKTASQGDYTLPEWGDWGGLIISGILSMVIMFVYMIPGFILMFAGMSGGLLLGDLGMIAFLLVPVGGILLFAGGLFGSLAIVKYAIDGSMGGAFAFGTIIRKALTVEYISSYVIAGIIGGIECVVFWVPGYIHMATALGETYPKL